MFYFIRACKAEDKAFKGKRVSAWLMSFLFSGAVFSVFLGFTVYSLTELYHVNQSPTDFASKI